MVKRFFCSVIIAGMILFSVAVCGIEVNSKSDEPAVKTAAAELQQYIEKMGQSANPAKFLLEVDPELQEEEWKIESVSGGVKLSGGSSRGVLYAAYHYLEDVCGVRWWSPREEDVPILETLPLTNLKLLGHPAFAYRCIYSLYARDKGAFAARMRMNDDHASLERLSPEYGGKIFFGKPGFVHTFYAYIPDSCFDQHPEWFSLIDGKRFKGKGSGSDSSQRCLSNLELRKEFKRRLREFIAQSEAEAKELNLDAPRIYDISQNDGSNWCECPECQAIVKRENALSGLIVDFINDIARDIAKDHPEILINTLAYNKTEKPPQHIKPEKNVMITLCNMRGNTLVPANPETNPEFYNYLVNWGNICQQLRVWDYNINYREYNELAYPSEYAYQDNLKLYRKMGVTHVFAEFESPNYSDVREYKVYLWLKLLENPDQDFNALRKQFAEGYFGKAGALFLQYRDLLKRSAEQTKPYIVFTPTPDDYTHLNLATVTKALQLFDEGEKLLKDDPIRLQRWQDAKLSLNRSLLYRSKILKREYLRKHGTLEGYPMQNEQLFHELRTVWNRRLPLRPLSQKEEAAKQEIETAIALHGRDYKAENLAMPARFKHIPEERLFDYTMENSSRFRNFAALADDPESEAGYAAVINFSNAHQPKPKPDDLRLPLEMGVYDRALKRTIFKNSIQAKMIDKRGYNWYKLGSFTLTRDAYFFGLSWLVQQPFSGVYKANAPNREYEIWVSLKFTGPHYPLGKQDEDDAVWLDRILLIRHE